MDARIVGVHPIDPTELLKLIKLGSGPTDPETSVGGSISVVGSADYWGCGREMTEYVLQFQEAPFGAPPPEQDDPGPWTDVKPPLPYSIADANHPRTYWCWPSVLPNIVLNGKLTRIWTNHSCLLFPPSTYYTVRKTAESDWGTLGLNLNGRYTIRLRVEHQPLGGGLAMLLYDAATVWLDNHPIQVLLKGMAIAGGGPLAVCEELSLSQFLGTTAEIIGRAWDPLIVNTVPATEVPNNNFDFYQVSFRKAGGPSYVGITTSSTRVPNVLPALPPPPGDVGTLANWDIVSALDAGPPPDPYVPPPYPKIYRGERCAYLIRLYATDTTRLSDGSDHHDEEDFFPFCIVNDL